MKCPWLINTVVETNNRNSYNDSRRSEKQEFGECIEFKCPFYYGKIVKGTGEVVRKAGCGRVNKPQ